MSKVSTIGAIGAVAVGTLIVFAGVGSSGKVNNANAKPAYPPSDFIAPSITKGAVRDEFVRNAERLLRKV